MTMKTAKHERFYQKEDTQTLRFFKSPKVLYFSALYRNLSIPAKVLYGILLDRLALSLKNSWLDDQGRVFVIFRGKPAQNDSRKFDDKPAEDLSLTELLNVDHRSLKKYKDELINNHLLVESRPGQGKSNRLYLLKPVVDLRDTYKKETPEHMLYSEDQENFSMHEIHELLLKEYGSAALEKAFTLTAGIKLPVKGYFVYMKRILEGFKLEATDGSQQFLGKQKIPFVEGTFI